MRVRLTLKNSWNYLTRPSPALPAVEQIKAHALATNTLLFILVGLFIYILVYFLFPPELLDIPPLVFLLVFLPFLVPFYLSRTVNYQMGAYWLVIWTGVGAFIPAFLFNPFFSIYLILPIITSSLFLSKKATYLTIVATFILLLIFLGRVELIATTSNAFIFLGFMTLLFFIAANIRSKEEEQSMIMLEERITEGTVELVQANAALQASESRFRALTEMTTASIFIFQDDKLQYVNPASEAITGYSQVELKQMELWKIVDEETREAVLTAGTEILNGERQPPQMEFELKQKDGCSRWIDVTLREVEFENEMVVIGTAFDITRRKVAEKEMAEQALELATLNRILTAVSHSLELPEIFSLIDDILVKELKIPGGGLFLYSPEERTLELRLQWGFPVEMKPVSTRFVVQDNMDFLAIYDRKTIFYPDFKEIPHIQAVGLDKLRPNWLNYISIPLLSRDKVQGLLNIFSEAPHTYSVREINFFESIGKQIGIAIQNSRLMAAERHARQLSQTIQQANMAFTQNLDLDTLLQALLDYLHQLIPYDSGNVMLRRGQDQVQISAIKSVKPWYENDEIQGWELIIKDYPTLSTIFETQDSLLIPDVDQYPDWQHTAEGKSLIKSWLGIPLISGGKIIGLYSLDKKEPHFFTTEQLRLAEALAGHAAIAIQNARLFSDLKESQEQLRLVNQQVVDAQEDERHRVSRELHDEAGQALTALKFSLAMIKSELPSQNYKGPNSQYLALHQHVKSAMALCETTIYQIRNLAHDLRPSALDDLGLNPTLEGYCGEYASRTAFAIHYEGVEPPQLPDSAGITLYRFLQESLTNVAKHASASQVWVALTYDAQNVYLSVQDNGRGISLGEQEKGDGIGLRGMNERLQLVSGCLLIESSTDGGTLLKACIPWSHPGHA